MDFELVVGTAGHIDHGKTTLVRALTGHDLDTLPEEKDRGITIALGFAPLELPTARVGLVDVPGHERLVRTMIAGVAGIDAVLLCISAVDGAMPQTREHLAILGLLGVRAGVVVVTMADLVEEEMLELALDDVAQAVAGTFLDGAPVVVTSAVSGRGMDELREQIALFEAKERPIDGPFRLPVDRTFQRTGFGTVATGTAWSGRLSDGATVTLLPGAGTARVRGIEVHGQDVTEALPGRRTAMNLAGVSVGDVPRGTVIALGAVPCPSMLDVRYHHLAWSVPLADGSPVRVLLGTAERIGKIHLAEEEVEGGASTMAQLRLDEPLPCMPGDRFVIRRTSPMETLGGGTVLDPWAAKLRGKQRVRWCAQLERLEAGKRVVLLERAGETGLSPAEWAERGGGSEAQELGGRLWAPSILVRLQGALLESLTDFHAEHPLSLGANRRELRRGRLAHLPEKVFDALVLLLKDEGQIVMDGTLLRGRGFAVAPNAEQSTLMEAVFATLLSAGVEGLRPKDVHAAHPEPEVLALLRLLASAGRIAEVDQVGWVVQTVIDELRADLVGFFADETTLATGVFKERNGLTRRTAIPWLEWLDGRGWTRREVNHRVRGAQLG